MIMPPLHGTLAQTGFFIYAACDSKYFDEFGRSFINSVLKNTNFGIHMHLYNPSPDHLDFCNLHSRVSVTYEFAPIELFKNAAEEWKVIPADPISKHNYERILNAMKKGGDSNVQERLQKTYFASARFIRLSQMIVDSSEVLAIDVDAIIRFDIPMLSNQKDFYIHHIKGKRARYLAGGILLTGNVKGKDFIDAYANSLLSLLEADNMHWGIDQDVLDPLVPKYNYGELPLSYIDWEMGISSVIWTAKGTRKDLKIFVEEKKKYS